MLRNDPTACLGVLYPKDTPERLKRIKDNTLVHGDVNGPAGLAEPVGWRFAHDGKLIPDRD